MHAINDKLIYKQYSFCTSIIALKPIAIIRYSYEIVLKLRGMHRQRCDSRARHDQRLRRHHDRGVNICIKLRIKMNRGVSLYNTDTSLSKRREYALSTV